MVRSIDCLVGVDAEGLGVQTRVGEGRVGGYNGRGVSGDNRRGVSGDDGSRVGGHNGAMVGKGASVGGYNRAVGHGSDADRPLAEVVVARQSLSLVVGSAGSNYLRGVEGHPVDGIQDDGGGVRRLSEGHGRHHGRTIDGGRSVDRRGTVAVHGGGAVDHAGAVLRHRAGGGHHSAVR